MIDDDFLGQMDKLVTLFLIEIPSDEKRDFETFIQWVRYKRNKNFLNGNK